MSKLVIAPLFIFFLSFNLNAQKKLEGIVNAAKNNTFSIVCEKMEDIPSKTDTCSVSKDISGSTNPFGIKIQSGWMGVADAVLVGQKGKILTFKIIKETSNIIVNGKKQVHFVVGKKMKIEWK